MQTNDSKFLPPMPSLFTYPLPLADLDLRGLLLGALVGSCSLLMVLVLDNLISPLHFVLFRARLKAASVHCFGMLLAVKADLLFSTFSGLLLFAGT